MAPESVPEPVNPAAKRVVELVMERLGFTSPAELAEALDMKPYSEGAISLVRRWLRGEHGPSFEYTMAMLSKAALLAPEADRAWRGELDPRQAAAAAADQAAAAEAAREAPPRRKRQTG